MNILNKIFKTKLSRENAWVHLLMFTFVLCLIAETLVILCFAMWDSNVLPGIGLNIMLKTLSMLVVCAFLQIYYLSKTKKMSPIALFILSVGLCLFAYGIIFFLENSTRYSLNQGVWNFLFPAFAAIGIVTMMLFFPILGIKEVLTANKVKDEPEVENDDNELSSNFIYMALSPLMSGVVTAFSLVDFNLFYFVSAVLGVLIPCITCFAVLTFAQNKNHGEKSPLPERKRTRKYWLIYIIVTFGILITLKLIAIPNPISRWKYGDADSTFTLRIFRVILISVAYFLAIGGAFMSYISRKIAPKYVVLIAAGAYSLAVLVAVVLGYPTMNLRLTDQQIYQIIYLPEAIIAFGLVISLGFYVYRNRKRILLSLKKRDK